MTCKGTLRQVLIRIYRLEIANCLCTVHSVMLIFLTQLCDMYSPLLPNSPSLWFNSPSLPFVNKHTVDPYTVCKGGGMAFWASAR